MTGRVAKVLFVDDDPMLLDLVRQLMAGFAQGTWEVLTAPDSASALKLLQGNVIDLIVIDVHMPVVDGPQLLKLLQRKYPQLLKVVLTGDATGAYRSECLANGAELFLEKPRQREGWQVIYSTLVELVKFKPESGFRGVLRRVGLQEVLQLECLARNSSILDVSTPHAKGQVFIQDGEVIHAVCGSKAGETAFYFLFGLKGGDFSLHPFIPPGEKTIDKSWESLLMEAAQVCDEAHEPDPPVPDPPDELEREFETALLSKSSVTPSEPKVQAPQAAAFRKAVDEMLICSSQGEVVYDWQCKNVDSRVAFLECVSAKSAQLVHRLPAGSFERVDIEQSDGRLVVQIKSGHTLFVRTRLEAQAAEALRPEGKEEAAVAGA